MKAHELLAKPESWTKEFAAKDKDGFAADSNDRNAVCWCLAGAVYRCYNNRSGQAHDILKQLKTKLGVMFISTWNDAPERTHAEVLAVLKELDI